MDTITTIILYLQEYETNTALNTLILMLPYDTAASLLCMLSVLKNIQDLIVHPISMIIPDTKAINALFHKLPPQIPFWPILDARLQQSLTSDLLQYLQPATSTYYTTEYKALQDALYLLQVIQEATYSHYFIKNVHYFHKKIN